MQKIGKFFLVLLFCLCSVPLSAAGTLKVEVQPDSVGVGDTVQIILTVQSTDDFEMADPNVPDIAGLKLLQAQNAGQSSSTRMNFINGKTEFSKSVQQQFVFAYEAVRSGIVVIPSFAVEVNGKQMMSAPQKIVISAKSQQRQRQQEPDLAGRPQFQQDDPFAEEDDMFAQLMQQRQRMLEEVQKQMRGQGFGQQGFPQPQQQANIPSRQIEGLNTNEAFFILLEADKKSAYEGEQITASWYIYTRGNLESLDRAKFPDLKGFWKEIIEEVPSLQFSEEMVNGVMYRKALLAAHALFPIKSGTTAIDEFKIKGKVRLPTQFGWGQAHEFTKSSRRMGVNVLPLPKENRPLSFSGAVGQFQVQTQIDGTQFPAGQPISLRIRFEGQGNAKVIELPAIQWPEGLEVYDTKSESKFFKDGLSYKEFEVLVIAKNPGEIKIPQINFSYFDPVTKQYVTKSTEEFTVRITEPVKGSTLAPLKATDRASTPAEVEKVFLPITQLSSSLIPWGDIKIPALLSISLGAALFVIMQFVLALRKLQFSPQLAFKVETKMQILENAVKNKNYKLFGAEAINLLYLMTAHLAQEQSATQDWAALFYKMPENYRKNYENKLNQLFDYFQMIGFAPESVREQALSRNSAEEMYKELKNTAHKIVSELPS